MIRLLSVFLLLATLDQIPCLLRGYKNSRSWGTGRQGKVMDAGRRERMGRQRNLLERGGSAELCLPCQDKERLAGPVCGTDGATYSDQCELRQRSCKLVRRQGRALQSSQLSLSLAHPGPCTSPCPELMQGLGQFSAWGVRATNTGLCIQDFFSCARTVMGRGASRTTAQSCCQSRFNQCFSG